MASGAGTDAGARVGCAESWKWCHVPPGPVPDVPLRVHIAAERKDGVWVFGVEDNGQGFAPEYAERVFRIFQRLHGQEVPGTGIGLAIVKTIVEAHGGRAWADATPGKGATFRFTLPGPHV